MANSLKIKIILGFLLTALIGLLLWKTKLDKTNCYEITSLLDLSKECVGKRVEAIGILICEKGGNHKRSKADLPYLLFEDFTELRFLEEVTNCEKYNWREVRVVGKFYKCGNFDQCVGYGLTDIESITPIESEKAAIFSIFQDSKYNLIGKIRFEEISLPLDKEEACLIARKSCGSPKCLDIKQVDELSKNISEEYRKSFGNFTWIITLKPICGPTVAFIDEKEQMVVCFCGYELI